MSDVAVQLVALFGAGVVSFAAPCVLPLLPAYLGVLGLDAGHGPGTGHGRTARSYARRSAGSLGFVAGLALTFALFGAGAARGLRLVGSQRAVEVAGGLVMLGCGLAACGVTGRAAAGLRVRGLRVRGLRLRGGLAGRWGASGRRPRLLEVARTVPVPLRGLAVGAAFGAGWSPCVGPLLGAALSTAALDGSAWRAAALLASFALGLGVPFVIAGLLLAQLDALAGAWRPPLVRWSGRAERLAGVVLLAVGAAVLHGGATSLPNPVATVARGVF